MKKLAVIVAGWHFPLTFYEQMIGQKIPEGWEVDFFVVAHRDPSFAVEEKKEFLKTLGNSRREHYDRLLYKKIPTVPELEAMGWRYSLEPNTMGEWGCVNQWLAKHDYKQYDKFMFSHDDNYVMTDQVLVDLLPQDEWLIITNSDGNSQRRLRQWLHLPKPFVARGSFEIYSREVLDAFGGTFAISNTKLTREGEVASPDEFEAISNWNESDREILRAIKNAGFLPRVKALSKYYRMSIYCLEGERGYISHSESSNTKEEDKGLDIVEKYYAKK
jgi:hypothetical protein